MVTTTGFIRCLCERKYGDNSNCPRHGSLMARATPRPSPSYTLAEIKQLAREYVDEAVNRTTDQLVLSLFLAWLAQREKENSREVVR